MPLTYQPSGSLFMLGTASTPCWQYDSSGSLLFTGQASTPSWGYIGSGNLNFSGIALTSDIDGGSGIGRLILSGLSSIVFNKISYLPIGKLTLSGLSSYKATYVYHTSERLLGFAGYCSVSFTIVPTPIPVTPIRIAGKVVIPPKPPRLLKVYNEDATEKGWFINSNAAYLPDVTARSLKKINKSSVPSGYTSNSSEIVVG